MQPPYDPATAPLSKHLSLRNEILKGLPEISTPFPPPRHQICELVTIYSKRDVIKRKDLGMGEIYPRLSVSAQPNHRNP